MWINRNQIVFKVFNTIPVLNTIIISHKININNENDLTIYIYVDYINYYFYQFGDNNVLTPFSQGIRLKVLTDFDRVWMIKNTFFIVFEIRNNIKKKGARQ